MFSDLFEIPGFHYGFGEIGTNVVMYVKVIGNPTMPEHMTCNKHLWQLYDSSPASEIDLLTDLLSCTGLPSSFLQVARGNAVRHEKTRRMHIVVGDEFVKRMVAASLKVLGQASKLTFDDTLEGAVARIQRLNS